MLKRVMEVIVVMFVILVGDVTLADGGEYKGVKGGVVVIQCSHSNAHKNVKYFCREPCKDSDVLVKSRKTEPEGRYAITDEGNTFWVTISDLEINDSGAYRCGIDRIGLDTYTKVVLNVTEDTQRKARRNNLPESFTKEANDEMAPPSNGKMLYIGTSLGVVILVLVVGLVIFLRHRRISTTWGKATDTPHTTPFCLEEDTQNPVTPSSCQTASQSEGAVKEATRGGGQVENIYSNAEYSAEPRAQSEDLCYTTVSFSTAPPESPVASIAEFYSIIRYLPQDESLVYSNV